MLLPHVVRPDLGFSGLGQMGSKQTAHRSTTHDANPHPQNLLRNVTVSPRCGFRRLVTAEETPRDVGEALPFRLPDPIRVLRIKTDFAITIDYLGMEGEDHVLLQRDFALRADCRV